MFLKKKQISWFLVGHLTAVQNCKQGKCQDLFAFYCTVPVFKYAVYLIVDRVQQPISLNFYKNCENKTEFYIDFISVFFRFRK